MSTKVMVIGANGVVGRQLVPMLVERGHEVVATSTRHGAAVPAAPARFVRLDLLDGAAVRRFVTTERPDVVVHLATAVAAGVESGRVGRRLAVTHRLRDEGTFHLAAAIAGSSEPAHLISQSYAPAYGPGSGLRGDDDPLWPDPPAVYARAIDALRALEYYTADVDGTVLRLGHLYGPGTVYAPDGEVTRQVATRKMPIVGAGASVFSFVHIADVATAILAVADAGARGAFNVVDDEPVAVRVWLPHLAGLLGARPPRRIPVWMARLAVRPFGVAHINEFAGASNSKLRSTLAWAPSRPSWTLAIADELRTTAGPEHATVSLSLSREW